MILPSITNKQKEIILLLYRFRFLNRIQIQTLLKNKDHRNINIWLKDLTQKKYVTRIYEKSSQINVPARYYISTNGIQYLKSTGIDKSLLNKFHQEKRRSSEFIETSIMVADIYLKLLSQNTLQNNSFKFYSPSDFPKKGILPELLPYFAYVYKVNNELHHFVGELFIRKKPSQIKGRIKKYIEYFQDDEGLPTNIIFICDDDVTETVVKKSVNKYSFDEEYLNINIFVATKKQVDQNGMEIPLFKKAE